MIEKVNKIRSWLFEEINQLDSSSFSLCRKNFCADCPSTCSVLLLHSVAPRVLVELQTVLGGAPACLPRAQ